MMPFESCSKRTIVVLNVFKLLILISIIDTFLSKKSEIDYHLITYSTDNHDVYAQKLLGTVRTGGFNLSKHYKPADLDDLFVNRNQAVLLDFKNGKWKYK